jgi:hypothetical protein
MSTSDEPTGADAIATTPIEPVHAQMDTPRDALAVTIATAVVRINSLLIFFSGAVYVFWIALSVHSLAAARSAHETEYYRIRMIGECAILAFHVMVGAIAYRLSRRIGRAVCDRLDLYA